MLDFLALMLLIFVGLFGVSLWIAHLLLYARRQPITQTPIDYGMSYEEITFPSKDGLTLKGWWIPQAATTHTDVEKPVVIILHPQFGNRHGLSLQRQPWPRLFWTDVDLLKLAQALHEAGSIVLLFDFRSHGESQRGLCAGGLTEDQDVMGAVNYVFARVGKRSNCAPAIGVIGFGLGAAAALAAVGREKGGAETLRVFSGDGEGGSGFIEIPPDNVKRLRFLVAIQPASTGVLLRRYLRQRVGWLAWLLWPVVNRICWWRGGFPLSGDYLQKVVRNIHIPILYLQSYADTWGQPSEVQDFYDATPGSKQLQWIKQPIGRLETYAYLTKHSSEVLAFVRQHFGQDVDRDLEV